MPPISALLFAPNCVWPSTLTAFNLPFRKEQRKLTAYMKTELQYNISQEAGIRKRTVPFLLSFAKGQDKWGADVVQPEQGNEAGKACYWDTKLTLWRTEPGTHTYPCRFSLSSPFSPFLHVPHLTAYCFGLSPAAAEWSRNRGLPNLSAPPGKSISAETGWTIPEFQVPFELWGFRHMQEKPSWYGDWSCCCLAYSFSSVNIPVTAEPSCSLSDSCLWGMLLF